MLDGTLGSLKRRLKGFFSGDGEIRTEMILK